MYSSSCSCKNDSCGCKKVCLSNRCVLETILSALNYVNALHARITEMMKKKRITEMMQKQGLFKPSQMISKKLNE